MNQAVIKLFPNAKVNNSIIELDIKKHIDDIIALTHAAWEPLLEEEKITNDDFEYLINATWTQRIQKDPKINMYGIFDNNILISQGLSEIFDEPNKNVNNHLYIGRMAVHPQYQSNGLFNQMINFLEDKAQKLGMKGTLVYTYRNNDSRKIFEKKDYQLFGNLSKPEVSTPKKTYKLSPFAILVKDF